MWYSAIYRNEILLLVPLLLSRTVRRSGAQRALDVARTVPLLGVLAVWLAGGRVSPAAWASTGAYTLVANAAMAVADTRVHVPFHATTYVLSHASVLVWLFGIGDGSATLRFVTAGTNLAMAASLVAVILVTVPYMDAWACYPSADVHTLTKGYCPQYTGDYVNNVACTFKTATTPNPRCDPSAWKKPRSLHDTIGPVGHFLAQAILASAALFGAMVVADVPRARVKACVLAARKEQ